MPPAKRMTPAEWVELLVSRGKALRDAGVTRLQLDDVLVELAPAEPQLVREQREDMSAMERALAEQFGDPLDDPATFGVIGRVPSLSRGNGQ